MKHETLQTIRDSLVHCRTVLNMRNLQLDVGPIHSTIKMIDEEIQHTQYVNSSEPAFPCGSDVTQNQFAPSCGLSMRDYFAAKAMQAMCEEVSRYDQFLPISKNAYKMADAMLEARK
jgi:UDP-N-acetylglucosamine pyrophosphorylase